MHANAHAYNTYVYVRVQVQVMRTCMRMHARACACHLLVRREVRSACMHVLSMHARTHAYLLVRREARSASMVSMVVLSSSFCTSDTRLRQIRMTN